MPETVLAMHLMDKLGGIDTLPIRNRPKSDARATFSATPSRSGGNGSTPHNGQAKRTSRLGGRRGQYATAIIENPSHLARHKAATRPIASSYPSVVGGLSPTRSASNGCTRRFSPSPPQGIKAKKSFS